MRHKTIRMAVPFIFASAFVLTGIPALAGGGAGGDGKPVIGSPPAGGAGGTGYLGQAGQDGVTDCANTNGVAGGGGGGGAGGGAGGSSGGRGGACASTAGGAGGTAASTSGQAAPDGGGGGGGGYNGNGAGTATINNTGFLKGGSGGRGGILPTGVGAERSGAGGGGGGGHGSVLTGPGASFNTGQLRGGDGGLGGLGRTGGAGGGGQGGIGLLIIGDGVIFSNTSHIGSVAGGTGGNGGNVGISASGQSGNGGDGGAGIVFMGAGGTLINGQEAQISGGSGGMAGTGGGGLPVAGGFGGVGVQGADLAIINAGEIYGGSADLGGGLRSNAISFTGGVNRLELQSGSVIVGNVVASGTSDTLTLGGDTDASFDISQLGVQYQGFDHFEKNGASVWTLTGTTTELTPWTFKGGVLSVSASDQLGDVAGGVTFDGGTLRVTGDAFNSFGARSLTWGSNGGGFDIADATNVFVVTQQLSGAGGLMKSGMGSLILDNANNTYTGATAIEAGTLSADGGGAIGDLSAVTISGGARLIVLSDETIGSLAGTGDVSLSALGAVLTTGGNNADTLFSGEITHGGVPGSGQIVKMGSGTMTMAGSTTDFVDMTVAAGKLVVGVGGAGSFAGTIDVQSGATLGGTGDVGQVTVEAGGTHAPGNSIGTQTVMGAYLLSTGSTVEIEANAAGASDKVVVVGSVDLSGAILRVLADNGGYAAATSYLVIDNDGADGVTGTFGQVTSNLAFLSPTVNYIAGDGNDVELTLTRNNTDLAAVAKTPNQLSVAKALDRTPSNDPLITAVVGQTASGAQQAFNVLSGELHTTVAGVLLGDSRYVRDAIFARLAQGTGSSNGAVNAPVTIAAIETGRMSLGADSVDADDAPPNPRMAFWTQGYGAWGDFEGDGNAAAAERTLGGFVSGMDARLGGTWRVGVATGYAHSNLGVDARLSSAEIESYHLAAYAGGDLGAFKIRAGGAWTWSDIDTARAILFPGFSERENASYSGDTGQIFGEAALPLSFGGLNVEPFSGLVYVHAKTDGFTESGAIGALASNGIGVDTGYSMLGFRAGTAIVSGDAVLRPYLSLAWQHAFGDTTPATIISFASTGIGFTVSGLPIAEDSALIETGLDLAIGRDVTLGAAYSGQIAQDVEDHAVTGKLNWRF